MRLELKQHNKMAYERVMAALETSNKTCVIHPTGTGKSFLIAAVSESYAKVLVLAPNVFVLGQVQSIMTWHKGAEFKTYTALNFNGAEDKYDLIVLDEFHRVGAQKWGKAVQKVIDENPYAKVCGTSATPIRYLDKSRDMSDEIFHGNVAVIGKCAYDIVTFCDVKQVAF